MSTPRYVILCGFDPVSWYFTSFPPVSPPPRRFKCNYLYVKVSYSKYKTNTSFHRKKSDPKVIIHVDSKNIFNPNKLYTTDHKIPLKKLFELLFKRYYPALSIPFSMSLSLSVFPSPSNCPIFHLVKRNVNFEIGLTMNYLYCYRTYPIAFHMFKIIYDYTLKALGSGTIITSM